MTETMVSDELLRRNSNLFPKTDIYIRSKFQI